MGLLSYLRGDDLRTDVHAPGEARSLPPAENELPLLGSYTTSSITPVAALQIADVWAAVRVLADAASSLPLHVYRDAAMGGRLRFRYTPGRGPQRMLTTADVVMVRGLSVDGLSGLSAVSQAAGVLGLSDELVKHALSYFDSKAAGGTARPAGVLRLGEDASFGEQDRTKERIRAESRPHGILVIQGDAEYMEIASKLDSAQFVEQRRLAAQEVARVFRIPPHMLGAPSADSMTYSNVEQESIEFVRYSLTPWLRRIELAISNDGDLAFERQYVKFEADALLRADAKTRADVYTAALDPLTGWMTREEVRRLEDLPPEPQGAPQVAQLLNAMPREAATNGNG